MRGGTEGDGVFKEILGKTKTYFHFLFQSKTVFQTGIKPLMRRRGKLIIRFSLFIIHYQKIYITSVNATSKRFLGFLLRWNAVVAIPKSHELCRYLPPKLLDHLLGAHRRSLELFYQKLVRQLK